MLIIYKRYYEMKFVILFTQNLGCRFSPITSVEFYDYSAIIFSVCVVKVIGNCIECPFHGWQFNGETGECSKIPYSSGKIPPQAKVKVWPSMDINGSILVWHDAEGREPLWFPEEMTDVKNRGMKYCGCSTHFMNVHIEVLYLNYILYSIFY